MLSRASIFLLLVCATLPTFAATSGWDAILESVNLVRGIGPPVLRPEETAGLTPGQLEGRLDAGAVAILVGASPAAEHYGFHATERSLTIHSIADVHDPKMSIVWEHPVAAQVFTLPDQAILFAAEKSQSAPVAAGRAVGKGRVLWLITDPGPSGRERFPYLIQALHDLGVRSRVTSNRLWVFFDSSYRLRADPGYQARMWRRNGVAALHIASWHFFEPDEGRDAYLRTLISACHKNAILVYAWVELPHVSDAFWAAHPEWREKTAIGSDAKLDWRQLMNLRNPDCIRAVRAGLDALFRRFDWDGVNLAELYFESLEGHENPSRFTPMNDDVRREFRAAGGFDPADLFRSGSSLHWAANASGLARFLAYRAALVRQMQLEWIAAIESMRREMPHLDLVLTHVDDLLDPKMKDKIGADAGALLPLLESKELTFLVEDPAPLWNMGPQRYSQLGAMYASRVRVPSRLAADINVVERYQDVYPTKQQTGVELFQEVHVAAGAFARVALYFESSIRRSDWPLVASAAARVDSLQRLATGIKLRTGMPVGVVWKGPAIVDGSAWPVQDAAAVWLAPGEHTIEPGVEPPAVLLLDLNADLRGASVRGSRLEFAYDSHSRALARLSKLPKTLLIDGKNVEPKIWEFDDRRILILPRGQHMVTVNTE